MSAIAYGTGHLKDFPAVNDLVSAVTAGTLTATSLMSLGFGSKGGPTAALLAVPVNPSPGPSPPPTQINTNNTAAMFNKLQGIAWNLPYPVGEQSFENLSVTLDNVTLENFVTGSSAVLTVEAFLETAAHSGIYETVATNNGSGRMLVNFTITAAEAASPYRANLTFTPTTAPVSESAGTRVLLLVYWSSATGFPTNGPGPALKTTSGATGGISAALGDVAATSFSIVHLGPNASTITIRLPSNATAAWLTMWGGGGGGAGLFATPDIFGGGGGGAAAAVVELPLFVEHFQEITISPGGIGTGGHGGPGSGASPDGMAGTGTVVNLSTTSTTFMLSAAAGGAGQGATSSTESAVGGGGGGFEVGTDGAFGGAGGEASPAGPTVFFAGGSGGASGPSGGNGSSGSSNEFWQSGGGGGGGGEPHLGREATDPVGSAGSRAAPAVAEAQAAPEDFSVPVEMLEALEAALPPIPEAEEAELLLQVARVVMAVPEG